MTSSVSRISADIDFEKSGYQHGSLRIPQSVDRSAYGHIRVPVAVLNGARGGPTVLLTGGNHGDEYEGPVALMKLAQQMPTMQISGRIIVIPGLNFPAFLAGTRTSPIDLLNMNRAFPGAKDGTITQMIVHYVENVLVPMSDFILDIHSGGASLNHVPTLLISEPENFVDVERYRAIVNAFGAPFAMVMDLLGEDRTFAAAAKRRGKMFLAGEFGGASTCDADALALVESGVGRVLDVLGVTTGKVTTMPTKTLLLDIGGEAGYAYSPSAGVFAPAFTLGQTVEEGQLAGSVFKPHDPWASPVEIRFRRPGVIVCARTFALVQPGDCVALVAAAAA